MKIKLCLTYLAVFMLVTSGCARLRYLPPQSNEAGIYHRVDKNITLWSLAEVYNISLKEIVEANRIPNANKIEVGQYIFIPNRTEPITIYPEQIQAAHETFIWPVKGKIISHFGSIKNVSKNSGVDIKAPYNTNIVASRGGKVTFCTDSMKGYGKTIILDHGDNYQTVYAYNAENLVTTGAIVKQNEVIAKVGQGGRANTPSLHFEIRKMHTPQNPFYFLP